ncbi:hypothetical protein [Aquimarina muelleri]|uniref:Uncharacterized protein n=1 Tax=Aquimarina muelleri TaxID=279356 RepID=A0A918N2Z3_9FLAO|nr:hypothetical protein [Aquimarina muelleri]MCX2763109.1 hypothetical protein [Aquimarina muelleri]GGX06599.1 hypothetical protein GCM10007384_05390 [Aquimarina muelleri]
METDLPYKIDTQRRLCIKKDLIELSQWIDMLSTINDELDLLKIIEKQLLKTSRIEANLQALRRKNTLIMGVLCKYEQELNKEYEYGKREYDIIRAKEHEKKRDIYSVLIQEFFQLKKMIYHNLSKYQRG